MNVGTYRCMLHDGQTTGIDIAPYHHGGLHLQHWWAQGKSCPIAVAVTMEPYLFCASTNGLGWGRGEYEFAGFLKGEPLEVVPGPAPVTLARQRGASNRGRGAAADVEQRREGPFASSPAITPAVRSWRR